MLSLSSNTLQSYHLFLLIFCSPPPSAHARRMQALPGRDLFLSYSLCVSPVPRTCLIHSRCSVNICWISGWMKKKETVPDSTSWDIFTLSAVEQRLLLLQAEGFLLGWGFPPSSQLACLLGAFSSSSHNDGRKGLTWHNRSQGKNVYSAIHPPWSNANPVCSFSLMERSWRCPGPEREVFALPIVTQLDRTKVWTQVSRTAEPLHLPNIAK